MGLRFWITALSVYGSTLDAAYPWCQPVVKWIIWFMYKIIILSTEPKFSSKVASYIYIFTHVYYTRSTHTYLYSFRNWFNTFFSLFDARRIISIDIVLLPEYSPPITRQKEEKKLIHHPFSPRTRWRISSTLVPLFWFLIYMQGLINCGQKTILSSLKH